MISEKCKTTYTKLNTFVTNVINRDVTPQLTNLQETKLDNKEYITTSFVLSQLATEIVKASINDKNNVVLGPMGGDGRLGFIVFKFECNINEYYEFNIVVTSTTPIHVYDPDDNSIYITLNTGTHTFKIGKNQLIIDDTSITYTDNYVGFINDDNEQSSEGRFYFSNKQWHHEATFFDKIYPIGSVHITTNSVNPSNYFDGEWERIQDTFLLASGTTYENGTTGGSATVTLTSAQSGVPAHSHKYQDYNTTYTLKTTNRKPGTSTAVAYGTSLTAGGGATERTSSNNTAANASQAHNNMPPYLAVYMWERVG